MPRVMKCDRCRKRYRGHGDWNCTLSQGVVTAVTCPSCQTAEENAEAVIKESTLVYGRDAKGRVVGLPISERLPETPEELVLDLVQRTERAVEAILHLVVDTQIPFPVEDIVQMVEDTLPSGYAVPHAPGATRRDMIRRIAQDILSGDLYEDEVAGGS